MRLLFAILMGFLMLLPTYGCSKAKKPPESQAKKVAPKEVKKEEEKPLPKPEEEGYVYEPKGRRDPFVSLIVPKQPEIKKRLLLKGAHPLEFYDVTDFRLIAVVWNNTRYAMVTAPDGKAYTITVGTTLIWRVMALQTMI